MTGQPEIGGRGTRQRAGIRKRKWKDVLEKLCHFQFWLVSTLPSSIWRIYKSGEGPSLAPQHVRLPDTYSDLTSPDGVLLFEVPTHTTADRSDRFLQLVSPRTGILLQHSWE